MHVLDAFVDPSGYILTDDHGIENAGAATVSLSDVLLYVHRSAAGGRNEYVVLERPRTP